MNTYTHHTHTHTQVTPLSCLSLSLRERERQENAAGLKRMHASLSLTHTQHTHMRYILGLNGHFARAKEREDMMEEERSRALMLSDSCRAEAQALAVTHMPTHIHSL
jgi:hypothetical protein